jgi:prepilin-type N-terminal cleavage/methylation domain-containing protein/prepilin-type processing-associated H-X9-DG protein
MTKKRNAFTLIELLVVIAIIALLLAILIPSLQVAKEFATGVVCTSHLNGLTKSWFLYAEDNDDIVVGGGTGSPSDPTNDWAPYQLEADATNLEGKEQAIMTGALFTYSESTGLYHCPSDRRYLKPSEASGKPLGGYRSYSIVGGLRGVGENGGWGIIPHKKISEIKSPGDKYVFVSEADGRGANMGSWVLYIRTSPTDTGGWVDPLTIWHNDRSTLGYADGHAEKHRWKDKSTLDMSENQTFYQNVYPEDSGDDLRYMVSHYPYLRPQ